MGRWALCPTLHPTLSPLSSQHRTSSHVSRAPTEPFDRIAPSPRPFTSATFRSTTLSPDHKPRASPGRTSARRLGQTAERTKCEIKCGTKSSHPECPDCRLSPIGCPGNGRGTPMPGPYLVRAECDAAGSNPELRNRSKRAIVIIST
jgi:hypothetical protein